MVFQHFNRGGGGGGGFPHLTILENWGGCTLAPIWVRKIPKREAEETAMYFLEKVKIPEQALKYPGQLSGGQPAARGPSRGRCACAQRIMLFRRNRPPRSTRDDQGGARHDDRAGRRRDDDAGGHPPRWALPRPWRTGVIFMDSGGRSSNRTSPASSSTIRRTTGPSCFSARSSATDPGGGRGRAPPPYRSRGTTKSTTRPPHQSTPDQSSPANRATSVAQSGSR